MALRVSRMLRPLPGFEVRIFPLEPLQFFAPHAGGDDRDVEGFETVTLMLAASKRACTCSRSRDVSLLSGAVEA